MSIFRSARKLTKLQQMPWRDRWLLIQACLWLPIVAIALSTIGFKPTQRVLTKLSPQLHAIDQPSQSVSSTQVDLARQTARSVNRAARYLLPPGSCLRRSLALWFLLKWQGIESKVCIGVRRQNGDFQAHAWVECNGQVANDSPEVNDVFSTFDRDLPFAEIDIA